jgi:hypothetical protein
VLGAIGMSALYVRTERLDRDVAAARLGHAIGKLEVRRWR